MLNRYYECGKEIRAAVTRRNNVLRMIAERGRQLLQLKGIEVKRLHLKNIRFVDGYVSIQTGDMTYLFDNMCFDLGFDCKKVLEDELLVKGFPVPRSDPIEGVDALF